MVYPLLTAVKEVPDIPFLDFNVKMVGRDNRMGNVDFKVNMAVAEENTPDRGRLDFMAHLVGRGSRIGPLEFKSFLATAKCPSPSWPGKWAQKPLGFHTLTGAQMNKSAQHR
jgi:hypothetical protein